jgi:hypothetical protein
MALAVHLGRSLRLDYVDMGPGYDVILLVSLDIRYRQDNFHRRTHIAIQTAMRSNKIVHHCVLPKQGSALTYSGNGHHALQASV